MVETGITGLRNSFVLHVVSAINFPLSIALAVSHKFLFIQFKVLPSFPFDSPLAHGLLRSVLFSFLTFGDLSKLFVVFFLLISKRTVVKEHIMHGLNPFEYCSPQAPLSMGILQARILVWVTCPPPRDPPNPGTEPRSPTLQGDLHLYHLNPQGSPLNTDVLWPTLFYPGKCSMYTQKECVFCCCLGQYSINNRVVKMTDSFIQSVFDDFLSTCSKIYF